MTSIYNSVKIFKIINMTLLKGEYSYKMELIVSQRSNKALDNIDGQSSEDIDNKKYLTKAQASISHPFALIGIAGPVIAIGSCIFFMSTSLLGCLISLSLYAVFCGYLALIAIREANSPYLGGGV